MKIYHNPRCSKSRNSLHLLQERNIDIQVIEYLKESLTKEELTTILTQLNIPAAQLIRKTEPIYKELFKDKNLSEKEWIEAMIDYPKLIERPIIVKGNKAVIGRPIENVIELINE